MEDDGRMDGALSESGSEEMVRAPPTKVQVVPREPRMRDAVVVGRGAGKEKEKKKKKGRRPW